MTPEVKRERLISLRTRLAIVLNLLHEGEGDTAMMMEAELTLGLQKERKHLLVLWRKVAKAVDTTR